MNENYYEGQNDLEVTEEKQITDNRSGSTDLKERAYEDSKGFLKKLESDHPGIGKKTVGTALLGIGGTIACTGLIVLTS